MAPNPVIEKEDGWYHADKNFITVDELTVRYEYKHGPFDSAKEAWEAFGTHLRIKTMKINGYQIREALKEWSLKRDLASEGFNDTLFAFENEKPDTGPEEHLKLYQQAENSIVALQEAQATYNLTVKVKLDSGEITLANAVKRIGGIGRTAKMLRSARQKKVSKGYMGDVSLVRDKDEEHAKKVITDSELTQMLTEKVREENKLRAAIAAANAREIDLDLDTSLLNQD